MPGRFSRAAVVPLSLALVVAVAACGDQGPVAPTLDPEGEILTAVGTPSANKTEELKEKPKPDLKCKLILGTEGHPLVADAGDDQTVVVPPGDEATVTLDGTGSTYGGCALNAHFNFNWSVFVDGIKGKKELVAKLTGEQPTISLGAGEYTASLFVSSTHFKKPVKAVDEAIVTIVEKTKPPAKDKTPPVVKPVVKGTLGNGGWYTSDVTVWWLVVDKESPVKHACGTTLIDTDGAGQVVTCTATSAGGTTTESVSIDRDATPPVVAWTGAQPTYDIDATVAITCAVTDATSGVASTDCQDVNGPAYAFAAGTNKFSASAEDVAGNQGSGSLSFEVQATLSGLADIVDDLVPDKGTANALAAKLRAGNGNGKGQGEAAANRVGAFINHVEAQRGKKISDEAADILVRWAETLQ